MNIVAVSAGESPAAKTRTLAQHALDLPGGGTLVDLSALSADGLLGRQEDPAVAAAVAAASAADVLVRATPVYRATYSGALKAFLDRFPTEGLRDVVVVLVATASVRDHYLSLDTGGRAVVASLHGWTAPTVVYATSADFVDGRPDTGVVERLRRAVTEARAMAAAVRAG